MNAPFAPDAPSAVPQRVRLSPAVLAQAESFIAQHEPDAFPPVRGAAGPLHAVGDRVTATLVGRVVSVLTTDHDPIYQVEINYLDGRTNYVMVPAFRLSAMEG